MIKPYCIGYAELKVRVIGYAKGSCDWLRRAKGSWSKKKRRTKWAEENLREDKKIGYTDLKIR